MHYNACLSNELLVPYNPEVQRLRRQTPYLIPSPLQPNPPNPPTFTITDEHQLFHQSRNPGSQEFQGGVVLLVVVTPYQIHPPFTRMV